MTKTEVRGRIDDSDDTDTIFTPEPKSSTKAKMTKKI